MSIVAMVPWAVAVLGLAACGKPPAAPTDPVDDTSWPAAGVIVHGQRFARADAIAIAGVANRFVASSDPRLSSIPSNVLDAMRASPATSIHAGHEPMIGRWVLEWDERFRLAGRTFVPVTECCRLYVFLDLEPGSAGWRISGVSHMIAHHRRDASRR